MSSEFLDNIIRAQKQGLARGITSICSAHPQVLQAAMKCAARNGVPLLVESTCNQVNQYGGYTRMTPEAFVAYIHECARQAGLPLDHVLLGGDHLGPNVWQNEPAESAMAKSADLVRAYIMAGYTKIHLDASMKLADDDPHYPLAVEIAAQRSAFLACIAEQACAEIHSALPRYVIGTEVPTPGGAQNELEELCITAPQDAHQTIEITHAAFDRAGISPAWERVLALVVQPGVEFGDEFVHDYQPEPVRGLVELITGYPNLVYEAHSTDYQTYQGLRNLVQDHFAILKVGPALTFAYREAIFSLEQMENELVSDISQRSNLIETLDIAMLKSPEHWLKYYLGDEDEKRIARKYSLSDRSRYYWGDPQVQNALRILFKNLQKKSLPLTLISQFSPFQYAKIRSGEMDSTPQAIIHDRIGDVIEGYNQACGIETFSPL